MLRKSTGQRRFSDYFGISKGQSQLDFVDVPLDTDIELYVDPYALHVSPVDWLRSCGDLVANYFDVLIQALKAKDHTRAMSLISNLHEPNETRLGQWLPEASKYHNFMIGALTEIFYPELTRPMKEQPADEGRKRIDIFFHNSASKGFFSRLVNSHKYHAPYISVECKNYSSDPANPEFDQLMGRLNRKRGFVGILCCRLVEDKGLMLKRCRDVVNNDSERLILVFDDNDVCALLGFLAANERKKIDEYLEDKLKEILA